MGELIIRRREMILPDNTPILPAGYQRVEYIERPTSAGTGYGWTDTYFMPSDSDVTVIKFGCVPLKKPNSGRAYIVAGAKNTSGNDVGFGVFWTTDFNFIGCYGGEDCTVQPNSGSSILNTQLDVVATRTPTYASIVCNGVSNRVDYTPRTMSKSFDVFLMRGSGSSGYYYCAWARVSYLQIENNGVPVVNLVPARRISDNKKGFYDTISGVFDPSGTYVAGPDVT